jgi:hypothetical protein
MKTKRTIAQFAFVALAFVFAASVDAADKKKTGKRDPDAPRTIVGEAVCGKCQLKLTDKCSNVIQRKTKSKTGGQRMFLYWLADNEISKKAHQEFFCKGPNPVSATGTVRRVGERKEAKSILTATKIGKPDKAKKAQSKN